MIEAETRFLARPDLQILIDELRRRGFEVIGPTVDQAAIVYSELTSVEQLPRGWTDEQSPGSYRLLRRDDNDGECFGFVVGPQAWKQYLFPPRTTLLNVQPSEEGWQFVPVLPDPRRYAFLGVRACDLAAIQVQDRVFLDGAVQDPVYRQRRESAFLIAVNCTQAASTCFCTSMKTGPRCTAGFDVAMTELGDGFLCEIGSDQGREILEALPTRTATTDELLQADSRRQHAVDQISRRLDTTELPARLKANLNHPHWRDVGERCLSCSNCTMVCPTCFCSSVSEVRDLTTGVVERQRTWDSCFNPDFSRLSTGPVRSQTADRYRQWLTHKLGTWVDQFGVSGCVGCGRCITWCPVGIELTEEANAIQDPAA